MKANVKTLFAATLIAGIFIAGGAFADDRRGNPYLEHYDGRTAHQYDYQRERPDYRNNDWRVARYVDSLQAEQRTRIEQGLRSGELTRFEAQGLMAEQFEIERLQRKYMADRDIDQYERRRLMNELEDASRNIWRQKHDAQNRYDFRPPWFAYYR